MVESRTSRRDDEQPNEPLKRADEPGKHISQPCRTPPLHSRGSEHRLCVERVVITECVPNAKYVSWVPCDSFLLSAISKKLQLVFQPRKTFRREAQQGRALQVRRTAQSLSWCSHCDPNDALEKARLGEAHWVVRTCFEPQNVCDSLQTHRCLFHSCTHDVLVALVLHMSTISTRHARPFHVQGLRQAAAPLFFSCCFGLDSETVWKCFRSFR